MDKVYNELKVFIYNFELINVTPTRRNLQWARKSSQKSNSEEFHFGGSLNLTLRQFDFTWVLCEVRSNRTLENI